MHARNCRHLIRYVSSMISPVTETSNQRANSATVASASFSQSVMCNPLANAADNAFGLVCLSVCPVHAVTFESFDTDTVFLPKRDYVTFGSLLSQFRLSSVVCLSVCL